MAWQDQQDQEKLRRNSGLDQLFGGFNGMMSDIGTNLGHFFEDAEKNAEKARIQTKNQRSYNPTPAPQAPAPAPRPDIPSSPNPTFGNKMQSDYGLTPSNPDTSGIHEQSQMEKLIGMLTQAVNADPYSGAQNPYMSGLDEARSSSLKALATARDQANNNFNESNNAVQGIYAKGKQDTLADNAVLQHNNDQLTGGLGEIYQGGVQELQADRDKEMQTKADMLSRLGIGQGGLGTAGEEQTKAIAQTNALGTAAQDKAKEYGAADISSNTARAEGLISEGAGRQAELRSQLSGILGQLSNKELDVNNQYANQAMQAKNMAYADNLQRQQALYGMIDKARSANAAQQNSILKSPVIAKLLANGGSSANGMNSLGNADAYISGQGLNAQDYANAYSDAIINSQAMPGTDPTDQQIMQAMIKHPGIDPNVVTNYVGIKKNPGKFNQSGGNSDITSMILPLLMGAM